MTRIFVALFVKLIAFTPLAAQEYWQQHVRYAIDVKLDTTDKSLEGFLSLTYSNNSPDTLRYIWFHLWPNAYRNDRTAFSAQQLRNGQTDFYFSSESDKGYIHRLNFMSGDEPLRTEDDAQYIDMIKVILNEPLLPGATVPISTPFRVKLPRLFSRGGHLDKEFAVAQWYPKPAVYDREGWHPMPYLDQGEFYASFADYDVRITVPDGLIVASTGVLQNEDELYRLKHSTYPLRLGAPPREIPMQRGRIRNDTVQPERTPDKLKTLHYRAENIHDFAWFASADYIVRYDTLKLSESVIDLFTFSFANSDSSWNNALSYMKDALRFRSGVLGEYPWPVASVVATSDGSGGGMEYPMITRLGDGGSARMLEYVIEHELGHNWFQGILASDECRFPWMDEGMNTYYDTRYMREKYGSSRLLFSPDKSTGLAAKLPEAEMKLALDYVTSIRKDQPVNTPSAELSAYNYALISYTKMGKWMELLERRMGLERFDQAMQAYYERWKFRHPRPEDFRAVIEEYSPVNTADLFALLDSTGPLEKDTVQRKLRPAMFFNFSNTDQYQYINIMPLPAYNAYDGFMAGPLVHNYSIPVTRFRFAVLPLYGFKSGKIRGLGRADYTWYKSGKIERIRVGISGAAFSMNTGTDSTQQTIQAGFRKIVPSVRIIFSTSPLSTIEKYLEWKTFIISEQQFSYKQHSIDSMYYPYLTGRENRYINQLEFRLSDYRKLYPWSVSLQVQQAENFMRSDLNARYFFNYKKHGGLSVRFFAASFAHLTTDPAKRIASFRYQPKLTAVRGNEDYTYSNFFTGRNEFEGFHAQQIMDRDGGLKLRTDLFSGLQGRSDKWVAAINLNTTIPDIFPVKIPFKLFFDAGTWAQAWNDEAVSSRFLYTGGIQLSLFNDLLNIYAPLVYSKVFKDNLQSVPDENRLGRRISFSVDIHRLNLKKISSGQIPF